MCLPCNLFFHTNNELTQHTASHDSTTTEDKSGAESDDSSSEQQQQQQSSSTVLESSGSEKTVEKTAEKPGEKTSDKTGEKAPTLVELPNGTKIELVQNVATAAMSLERMRMLLAILLKRISTPNRLRRLGYGQKLIDTVLVKSIESSGRNAVRDEALDTHTLLKQNIEILLDWTIPSEYMERFRADKKTVEEILEELTS